MTPITLGSHPFHSAMMPSCDRQPLYMHLIRHARALHVMRSALHYRALYETDASRTLEPTASRDAQAVGILPAVLPDAGVSSMELTSLIMTEVACMMPL